MVEIFDLVLKLIYLAGAAFVVYLLPKLKAFIETKLEREEAEKLCQLVTTFVLAAEQTMKLDGVEKKLYVEQQLEALGVEVTDYIEALIEQAVYTVINGDVKEVQVKQAVKAAASKKTSTK